jgi:hypothetical protein
MKSKKQKINIRCPKCYWKPKSSYLWECNCGHLWNTFTTYGVCPACNKRWEQTQCFSSQYNGCSKMSNHEEWYDIKIDFESLFNQNDKNKLS